MTKQRIVGLFLTGLNNFRLVRHDFGLHNSYGSFATLQNADDTWKRVAIAVSRGRLCSNPFGKQKWANLKS